MSVSENFNEHLFKPMSSQHSLVYFFEFYFEKVAHSHYNKETERRDSLLVKK